MKFCFRVHCSRVSVYICMFRFRYRTYTKYSTGSTKSSVQRPSRILKHRSPTKRKPTLWRIRLMTSDGHFLFLPRICRHRKDTRHRNHTLYIITHKNIRFLPTYVLQYADEDLYFFQRPCLKEPTKQDDEIQDVSEVCGLGLWNFTTPLFSSIALTPYMYSAVIGTLLALRMPLQCPFSNFRCNMSSIQNRKRARTMDIYTISFKMHCSWLLCLQTIYVYIFIYVLISDVRGSGLALRMRQNWYVCFCIFVSRCSRFKIVKNEMFMQSPIASICIISCWYA